MNRIPRWVWPLFVLFVTQCVYLHTLNPAFPPDDSGETITAGVTLGIQHPPSYALAAFLDRIVSFIPLGGFGFRASWGSSLAASLAAALFTFVFFEMLSTLVLAGWIVPFVSVLTGLGLAFSPTYWECALSAKGGIYGLSLCFQLGILLCLLAAQKRTHVLGFCFFLMGLSLTNHWETMIVWVVLSLLFIRLQFKPASSIWIRGMLFFLLGLSPLLFLPLRASLNPVLNLGDPRNLSYFWADLSRAYFGEREHSLLGLLFAWATGHAPFQDVLRYMTAIFKAQWTLLVFLLTTDLGPVWLILSVLGFWRGWKSFGKKWNGLLTWAGALFLISLFSYVSIPKAYIWGKFLLPFYWVLLLWAGSGLAYLFSLPFFQQGRRIALAMLVLTGMMALDWADSYIQKDQSQELLAYDYGVNLLKALPKGSLFFAESDEDYFSLYYLQQVEHLRPDVAMVPTFILFEPWGAQQVEREGLGLTTSSRSFPDHFARIEAFTTELVDKNKAHRPIGFSRFNGAFHRYYLNLQKGLKVRDLGLVWFLESPTLKGLKKPKDWRVRETDNAFFEKDGSLQDLKSIYQLAGVMKVNE